MANIFRYFTGHNIALALAFGSFAPVAAFQPAFNLNANNVGTVIRLAKLIDKAKKNFKKEDVKKLIANMLELKSEAEFYTNDKFDLNKCIDSAFSDLRNQGIKVDERYQKAYKNIVKTKGKRYDHKKNYMMNCLVEGIEYDSDQEKLIFSNSDIFKIASKNSKSKNEDEEVDVPLKLIVGITCALCGFFILMIPLPIPGKEKIATGLITAGLKYAGDSIIECQDEKNGKNKQEKKGSK